jgi:hypothetical protein
VLTSNIGAQCILDEVKNQSSPRKISNGELSQRIKDRIMKEVCILGYFYLENNVITMILVPLLSLLFCFEDNIYFCFA